MEVDVDAIGVRRRHRDLVHRQRFEQDVVDINVDPLQPGSCIDRQVVDRDVPQPGQVAQVDADADARWADGNRQVRGGDHEIVVIGNAVAVGVEAGVGDVDVDTGRAAKGVGVDHQRGQQRPFFKRFGHANLAGCWRPRLTRTSACTIEGSTAEQIVTQRTNPRGQ